MNFEGHLLNPFIDNDFNFVLTDVLYVIPRGIGQVYLCDNWLSGLLIWFGILISSRYFLFFFIFFYFYIIFYLFFICFLYLFILFVFCFLFFLFFIFYFIFAFVFYHYLFCYFFIIFYFIFEISMNFSYEKNTKILKYYNLFLNWILILILIFNFSFSLFYTFSKFIWIFLHFRLSK